MPLRGRLVIVGALGVPGQHREGLGSARGGVVGGAGRNLRGQGAEAHAHIGDRVSVESDGADGGRVGAHRGDAVAVRATHRGREAEAAVGAAQRQVGRWSAWWGSGRSGGCGEQTEREHGRDRGYEGDQPALPPHPSPPVASRTHWRRTFLRCVRRSWPPTAMLLRRCEGCPNRDRCRDCAVGRKRRGMPQGARSHPSWCCRHPSPSPTATDVATAYPKQRRNATPAHSPQASPPAAGQGIDDRPSARCRRVHSRGPARVAIIEEWGLAGGAG